MIKNILVEIDYVSFDFVGGFLEDFTVSRLLTFKKKIEGKSLSRIYL
jgi:hypothetical protein